MILAMNSTAPLYREVQPYRELPPFVLLVVVGTLFGWLLIAWVAVLGRPLGALDLPVWLSLAIGLPLGLLLPIAYGRLTMVTEVYPDKVIVNNGMSSRKELPLAHVIAVQTRSDNIHGDYNDRLFGATAGSHTAHTVTSDKGVELTMDNGGQILIGSKDADRLGDAVLRAWQAFRPQPAGGEGETT